MKHVLFLLFSLITLQSVVAQSKPSVGEKTTIKSTLSTPENSWKSLIKALKTGNTEQVKAVVTEKGYADLMKYIVTNEEDPILTTFRNWGKSWERLENNWRELDKTKMQLKAGPIAQEHVFVFLLTSDGWRMDSCKP